MSTSENLEQVPVTINYRSNRKSTNPDLPQMQKQKQKKNIFVTTAIKKNWVGPNFGGSVGQQQTNLFLFLTIRCRNYIDIFCYQWTILHWSHGFLNILPWTLHCIMLNMEGNKGKILLFPYGVKYFYSDMTLQVKLVGEIQQMATCSNLYFVTVLWYNIPQIHYYIR